MYACGKNLTSAIHLSHKFILSEKPSSIINGMSIFEDENDKIALRFYKEQERSIGFFSLPYPYLWIELYADIQRLRTNADRIRNSNEAPDVSKLGFLLIQDGKNSKKGSAFIFWKFKGKSEIGMAKAYLIFDFNNGFDFEHPPVIDEMHGIISPNISWNIQKAASKHYRIMDFNGISKVQSKNACIDWVGENIRLFWSIILLNSKNGFEVKETHPSIQINKARVQHKKLPLMSYHVVDLSKKYSSAIESNPDGSCKRLHWRRGHFKYRKTGVFWWSPHLSGQKKMGFIKKHYAA